jgi:hypothetical protein
MPHNGGLFQTGFNFLLIGHDYPFINHVKATQSWEIAGVGFADPSNVNADGYIKTTVGTQEAGGLCYCATQADRPGNYVLKWTGGGATTQMRTSWLGTVVEGSNTGPNGRCVVQFNPATEPYVIGRCLLRYYNVAGNAEITNMVFCHEDDEALYDAGEVWSPYFKQQIVDKGFGLLRDLDWKVSNVSNLRDWEHRTPVSYVSYAGEVLFHDLWAGEATRTGTAYTVAKPGFTLSHGKQVHVRWGTAGTVAQAVVDGQLTDVIVDTLNVEGTGDILIQNRSGDPHTFGNGLPAVGYYSTLTYDAELNIWIMFGGNSGNGNKLISGGVPFELFLRLCKEVGAHPWFVQTFLSAGYPHSNLMTELALYADNYRTTEAPWMIPHYELVHNENWNSAGAFYGTRYGWNKGQLYWGSDFQTHRYHGQTFSQNAQAIWDALGVSAKTPSRFKLINAVQTYGGSTDSTPRLTSPDWVAADPVNNKAAYTYTDVVAFANYYGIVSTDQALISTELVLAMDYDATSDPEEQAAILVDYIALYESNIPQLRARYQDWIAWGNTYGITTFYPYEGGYSPDYTTVNLSAVITGITRGATTRVFTTGRLPVVGLSVTFNDQIVGTIQLHDQTGTVTAVGSNYYDVNIDSSAMTAWVSGGTVTYLDTKLPVNKLRYYGRTSPALPDITRAHIESFFRVGARYWSKFMFSGDGYDPETGLGQAQIWAGFFPDIYGSECQEMEFLESFNDEPNQLNFTIRL